MILIRRLYVLIFLIRMQNKKNILSSMSYNYIYSVPNGLSTITVSSIASCESNKYIKNRFCYSYTAPGFINTNCKPVVAATNAYLSSISCSSGIMSGATERSRILARQSCFSSIATACMVQCTIQQSTILSNQIYSQLIQAGAQRYLPYQPYIFPVVPSSVTQLQMATANVGVPMTPITCQSGKGNQTVTS